MCVGVCECGLSVSALISQAMMKKRPVLCGFMLLSVRESAMLGKHVYQAISRPTGCSVGGPNSPLTQAWRRIISPARCFQARATLLGQDVLVRHRMRVDVGGLDTRGRFEYEHWSVCCRALRQLLERKHHRKQDRH